MNANTNTNNKRIDGNFILRQQIDDVKIDKTEERQYFLKHSVIYHSMSEAHFPYNTTEDNGL